MCGLFISHKFKVIFQGIVSFTTSCHEQEYSYMLYGES